ncbi:MAG: hypothetical protein IJI05_05140 [Erysipelotrichaceae bacterium]|nr:hypothetical protein [Erysipelotrichaceae bacterium]
MLLYLNRDVWANHKELVFIPSIFLVFFFSWFVVWYDTNADRRIIEKMTGNGDIALAEIKSGSFVRFVRNDRMQQQVLWQLEITIYDQDMNSFDTTMIEKFATSQTSIPQGHVYVTYDPAKPDCLFIIPNVLLSAYPQLQETVVKYESNKKIKLSYLNAFYNKGMILMTFRQTIKGKKEK